MIGSHWNAGCAPNNLRFFFFSGTAASFGGAAGVSESDAASSSLALLSESLSRRGFALDCGFSRGKE